MRFTSLLFALPLLSSVFAAPLAAKQTTDVEVRTAGETVDYLEAVLKLKADVAAAGSISVGSTQVEVVQVLTAVDVALKECAGVLGIDLSVGAGLKLGSGLGLGIGAGLGLGVKVDGLTSEVAQVLAEVIQIVNGLVVNISAELRVDVAISGLLGSIDNSLKCILITINAVLKGCLKLVFSILVKLGCKIDLVLTGVIGLVQGVYGGVIGIVGGLLGSGRPCNC